MSDDVKEWRPMTRRELLWRAALGCAVASGVPKTFLAQGRRERVREVALKLETTLPQVMRWCFTPAGTICAVLANHRVKAYSNGAWNDMELQTDNAAVAGVHEGNDDWVYIDNAERHHLFNREARYSRPTVKALVSNHYQEFVSAFKGTRGGTDRPFTVDFAGNVYLADRSEGLLVYRLGRWSRLDDQIFGRPMQTKSGVFLVPMNQARCVYISEGGAESEDNSARLVWWNGERFDFVAVPQAWVLPHQAVDPRGKLWFTTAKQVVKGQISSDDPHRMIRLGAEGQVDAIHDGIVQWVDGHGCVLLITRDRFRKAKWSVCRDGEVRDLVDQPAPAGEWVMFNRFGGMHVLTNGDEMREFVEDRRSVGDYRAGRFISNPEETPRPMIDLGPHGWIAIRPRGGAAQVTPTLSVYRLPV